MSPTKSTNGSLGSFEGTGYNRHSRGTGFIQVLTNAGSFSSADLRMMNSDYIRRYPERGHPPLRPGERAVGVTFSFGIAGFIQVTPYVNYLANDVTGYLATPDGLRRLQVHELGHSLSDITGRGKGSERGKELEDCVFPPLPKVSSPRRR